MVVTGAKDCSWLTPKFPGSQHAAVLSTIVVCNLYFGRMRVQTIDCSLQVGTVAREIEIGVHGRRWLTLLFEITTVSALDDSVSVSPTVPTAMKLSLTLTDEIQSRHEAVGAEKLASGARMSIWTATLRRSTKSMRHGLVLVCRHIGDSNEGERLSDGSSSQRIYGPNCRIDWILESNRMLSQCNVTSVQ